MTDAQRVLVLGGTASGKSSFAEQLLTDEPGERRYLATGRHNPDDADWQARLAAHRHRRGDAWLTVECGKDPEALLTALAEAPADASVLVDDLGGWVGLLVEAADESPVHPAEAGARLAEALGGCQAARLVLVSPEVGLSVLPATRPGRIFTDVLGACNQAAAATCDAVALVVAGRTLWLTDTAVTGTPAPEPTPTPAAVPEPAVASPPVTEPADIGPAEPDDEISGVRPPDRVAINDATARMMALATGGAGLGALAEPAGWAIGCTGRWDALDNVRVILVGVDHGGGAAAGATAAADRIAAVEAGTAPLARLADRVGVTVSVADLAGAELAEPVPAMEITDVLDADRVDRAVAFGRQLADRAADSGVQLLVPAAADGGAEAAAAAVLSAATGSEPAGLLGRVVGTDGAVDDQAWIARCVAVRDALRRIRSGGRDARSLLAMLGGTDLATLTGLLIGAAIRQLPVLVDNPATAAAMILARDLAPSSPWWCLIGDHGRNPALKLVCDLLDLEPFLDLGLGLGDGVTALTTLGVLQPALELAGTIAAADTPAE